MSLLYYRKYYETNVIIKKHFSSISALIRLLKIKDREKPAPHRHNSSLQKTGGPTDSPQPVINHMIICWIQNLQLDPDWTLLVSAGLCWTSSRELLLETSSRDF